MIQTVMREQNYFILYINIVIKSTIVVLDQMEHKDLEERSFSRLNYWNHFIHGLSVRPSICPRVTHTFLEDTL